ncbi:MAG: peroxiredoxin [Elusimicrobia bacterium]|nr:peroxiredoxin [Elusimicrobiota bacterium]
MTIPTVASAVLFGTACLLTVPAVLQAASAPKAGSEAPDFSLPAQDGAVVSLKALRGKWVVLYFYPKDFTSGCTREAHGFQRDEKLYSAKNAVVLGISLDSVESHKKFCAQEGLRFKVLSDADHKVARRYGSLTDIAVVKFAKRNTFIIDPKGVIARVFMGVSPDQHSEEVLAALDGLRAR